MVAAATMTERDLISEAVTPRVASCERPAGPVMARGYRRHPLLEPFPLAVMTLATFMVLFVVMMTRLTVSAGTITRTGVTTATAMTGSGPSSVTTRTSGAGATAGSTEVTASGAPAAATPAVPSCTSASDGASGAGDDQAAC
jgi:hypothetical protein